MTAARQSSSKPGTRREELSLPRIGTDEAGKGDYFGYLVVSGVVIPGERELEALRALGLLESKRHSDKRNIELARKIARITPVETVKISPSRYNQLHAKFGNLNKLLAWAHARVMENLVQAYPDTRIIITDQFAPGPELLRGAMFGRSESLELIQLHGAEKYDESVAAASIVARAEFLRSLEYLSSKVGCPLPKGASNVESTARLIYRKHGMAGLAEVAKLHFKITDRITGE